MRYLTPRKGAENMGAAHSGTTDHWFMTVTAVVLAFMVPCFLIVFGRALGRSQAGVIDMFSQPFPALLTALVAVVGMSHFAKGAKMMIQDYTGGITRKALVIAAYSVAYLVMAVVLYALAKMTFLGIVLGAMN